MPPSRLRTSVPCARPVACAAALAVLGCFAAFGCGAGSQSVPVGGGTGGAGQGAAGAPGGGAGATLDGGGAPDGAASATCPVKAAALRQSGVVLSLALEPRLDGKPFVFGEPNARPSGERVTPLNFRFFMSHAALLTAGGASVPVNLVTPAGAVEPYDVHLFNAEEPVSQVVRVLAPPGSYVGLSFLLGLDDACNSGLPGDRMPPLTDSSQLTWPHLAGYLFLRLEDQVEMVGGNDAGAGDARDAADALTADAAEPGAGASLIPTAVHMGGMPGQLFAPTVTARGALALTAGVPVSRTLQIDVGAIFAGAEADVDAASLARVLPFPEVQAGERLRQHAPDLPLFVLAP